MGDPNKFMGHYVPWREARLNVLLGHFGRDWFVGKHVLELGCGFGHIGIVLTGLGAKVTFADARRENLDMIRNLCPVIGEDQIIQADLEREWPFTRDRWDLILHLGVIYHLTNWSFALEQAAKCCRYMVLEGEVLDSPDPSAILIKQEDSGDPQNAFGGRSLRIPALRIEEELNRVGFSHYRCNFSKLNSGKHKYNWRVSGRNVSDARTRRWWWCQTST